MSEIATRATAGTLPVMGGLERYRGLVDDWPGFVAALARPLPTCLWAHPSRIGASALAELLASEGIASHRIRWRPGAYRVQTPEGFGNRWWYQAGLCHAQEEVSMLPVRALGARPGERILDLCAAPGGKTAEIALALDNRGTVVANDISVGRARALRSNVARLGLVNVSVTIADGTNLPRAAGFYDRVLLDAPCSGEGTLRRRSRPGRAGGVGRWRKFRGLQEALLRKAIRLCRPGGRIVYSTCTFAPEENEAVVDTILRETDALGVRVLPIEDPPAFRTCPGVVSWQGQRFLPALRHARRVWPHHNDTGGFFLAVLSKERDPVDRDVASREDASVPRSEWPAGVVERFGIPEKTWERFGAYRAGTRGLQLADRDHRPPRAPEPRSIGVSFIRKGGRFPKLATAAALLLAPHVTANAIELDGDRLASYLRRESLALAPGQSDGCSGTGYVLITHRGFAVGTGLLDAEHGRLHSLFPKRWGGSR